MLEQRSFVYVEIANLLKKKNLTNEALDFKLKAFEFIQEVDKYRNSDILAELACNISSWFEELNMVEEGLSKLSIAL